MPRTAIPDDARCRGLCGREPGCVDCRPAPAADRIAAAALTVAAALVAAGLYRLGELIGAALT